MKKIVLSLVVPALMYAHTMPELFDALKNHSQTKSDELVVKKSEIYQDMSSSALYPKINLFGKFDNYSSPTNMKPIAPNVLKPMLSDQSIPQPYSYNIFKEGVSLSMPLFVKSIFTTAQKAKAMQKSSKAKKHINLLQNEAVIVGANANLIYVEAMQKALRAKEHSLLETKKTLQIKVDNGRAAKSALYNINDGLNQIKIAQNELALQKQNLQSMIEALTGIVLEEPIEVELAKEIEKNDFVSLQPLREKLRADALEIKVQKEKLYPALYAQASYTFSQANAYNNDKRVNEEYGDVGLTLNIPILSMTQYDQIALSKIEHASNQMQLQKQTDELQAKAKMLESSLPLLEDSITLYAQSIEDKEKLLHIAKVSYNNGNISTEEYLRYEDELVLAKANLYKTKAQKIQTVMQLAVIYANDIEEMIK